MEKVISGIPVEIERKNIRSLRLRVCPPDGRVFVSAPHLMPEETIVGFVEAKTGWIRMHAERMRSESPAVCRFEDGELLPLRGKPVELRVCRGDKSGFELYGSLAVLTLSGPASVVQRAALYEKWARRELAESVERLLPKLEKETGLHCENWYLRDMKSRWGSCNVNTGRICLNLQLVRYPEHCTEYVLLHELTHLLYPNHGIEFYSYLSTKMPDWTQCELLLNPGRHIQ